ncbi:olfactory receptor 13C7-like [Pteronotus mesoamericanus]|uniref:olfactory receptor 13C7-like n=1 Tax=Pteronotus mesoamericanus TaxID=1884717 RepID=UPI0023EB2658|nr:olfactory receptor 13C7-like [Pteronotus parnellii mesoamericanus]
MSELQSREGQLAGRKSQSLLTRMTGLNSRAGAARPQGTRSGGLAPRPAELSPPPVWSRGERREHELGGANQSAVTEYVLLGLQGHYNLEMVLFVLCLGIYSVNMLGNGLLLGLNMLDPRLQSPMYFFLSNLSLMDICGTSSFVPLMLVNFLKAQRVISFPGCALQMYLTLALGSTECLLLLAMAYDRYVAICQPLRYPELMSGQVCMQMAVLSWGTGFANALLHSIVTWSLPFCGHNVINHFFCEILAVLKLACGDTSLNALLLIVATAVLSLAPFLLICLSYIFILAAIFRVPSAAGRRKAFSTCSAHLTVVVVFYGTIAFMYFKPKAKDPDLDKIMALFYGLVTPSLNPVIYSLRNAEVKAATIALFGGDLLSRKMSCFSCCSLTVSGRIG